MSKSVPQTQDKYVLRLPDGMRDRIKAAAEASGRSMNAEIVERLEWSLASWPHVTLSKETIKRAFDRHPADRKAFEVRLQSVAEQLAADHFPDQDQDFYKIDQAFSRILDIVDDDKREDVLASYNRFMQKILLSVPLEVQMMVSDTVDFETGQDEE